MSRGDVGFVLGLAGFLLGGWAVFTAMSMKSDVDSVMNERKSDEESINSMGARVEDLDRSHKDLSQRVNGLSSDPKMLREALERLNVRVQKLEEGRAAPKPNDGDAKAVPVIGDDKK